MHVDEVKSPSLGTAKRFFANRFKTTKDLSLAIFALNEQEGIMNFVEVQIEEILGGKDPLTVCR